MRRQVQWYSVLIRTQYCDSYTPQIIIVRSFLLGISEVPDIKFIGNSSRVTEDDGTMTVCAVSGQLAKEFTPFTVTISTVSNTVKGKL